MTVAWNQCFFFAVWSFLLSGPSKPSQEGRLVSELLSLPKQQKIKHAPPKQQKNNATAQTAKNETPEKHKQQKRPDNKKMNTLTLSHQGAAASYHTYYYGYLCASLGEATSGSYKEILFTGGSGEVCVNIIYPITVVSIFFSIIPYITPIYCSSVVVSAALFRPIERASFIATCRTHLPQKCSTSAGNPVPTEPLICTRVSAIHWVMINVTVLDPCIPTI